MWFTVHMAKLLHGKTVITLQNDSWGTTVFEAPYVSISSLDKGKTYTINTETAKQSSEAWAGATKKSESIEGEQHKKLVAAHAASVLEKLKLAETSQLQAKAQLEKLGLEIAEREQATRLAIRLAVHTAIQAGLDMEEVTADMRDDYAGYVADTAIKVYEDTDLDTLVNVS